MYLDEIVNDRTGSRAVTSALRHRARRPLPGAPQSAWPTGLGGKRKLAGVG